jgi:PAS domain S-box-containing protein
MILGAIASLHLLSDTSPQAATMHLLFRKLYYVPIMYAGFAFGWRGGFAVAVASVVLLAPHARTSSGMPVAQNVDNLYEMAMYLTIGLLFGWLRDLEERKAADLRQVSLRLEQAYHTLEERAIQLVNIQDYTGAILRSITSGVITVSPDGSVATVNVAAERMLGMREEDMVPRRIGRLFTDDGGLDGTLTRFLSGQSPKTVSDVQAVTIDGRTVHLEVAMARMRDRLIHL